MDNHLIKETLAGSLASSMAFPQVVGKLLEAGVESYHVDLLRKEYRYYSPTGESTLEIGHDLPPAAEEFKAELVQNSIRQSQQKQISYMQFLDQILKAGSVYYIAYLIGRQVIYFGRHGDMHIEKFPT